jgi:signal transduction histidine kinase
VLGHDLRTPLSVVMNGAMLLPMMTDHPKVAVTAQRIQSSARRMTSMVDQLLDLARIRAGEMQLKPTPLDIGQLCRSIADEFTVPERASRVHVTHSGDPVAPVDSGVFAQALSNLLGNALQHGDADAPVSVQIDGRAPDRLSIAIGNRGAIPAERLAHIFEPFQHRDGARKSGQGLGLGLYTASTFIRAHGGDLAVASDAAGGTTVLTVTLPRPHAPRSAAAGDMRSGQRQMA